MVKQYRKKPVVIEAIQFTGNDAECMAFCPKARYPAGRRTNLIISTLEGDHLCSLGDYIIKGVAGEYYACKPDIFEQTYEPAVDKTHCPECGGSERVPCNLLCEDGTCPYPADCPHGVPCPACQGKEEK